MWFNWRSFGRLLDGANDGGDGGYLVEREREGQKILAILFLQEN